jgi:dihydrolipoamide dehydrogenase
MRDRSDMAQLHCDVAVIGAGTAGLAAERTARRAGATTLLIDTGFSGTTCARIGCMPSKLLIAAADAAHAVREASGFGLDASLNRIDGKAVMARLRRERDAFVAGVRENYAGLPGGVRIDAKAKFTGPKSIALDDGRRIEAKAIVMAVGAKPVIPAAFEAVMEYVLTNETIFEVPSLPSSIAVVGAGPLGLELAQALARLGVDVMVFDEGSRIAGLDDQDLTGVLLPLLEKDMPILLDVKIDASKAVAGGVCVRWSGSVGGERTFERLLVATGRAPRLDDLDMEASQLVLDKRGTPEFDRKTMQCGSSAIFIAGDADHERAVLHDAASEGSIAGRNAACFPHMEGAHRAPPFSIMFTDPPLAVLGEIGSVDDPAIVRGCTSYADQGRAKIMRRNAGAAHIYADAEDGRIIGAALACPGAEHLAHLLVWAVERRQTATDLLALPIYHPTYEEGLKPALRAICSAVHASTAADRDDGFLPGA